MFLFHVYSVSFLSRSPCLLPGALALIWLGEFVASHLSRKNGVSSTGTVKKFGWNSSRIDLEMKRECENSH